ncbi:hypothetical protein MMC2321_00480 [Chitinophaga sp. MM2321]
MDNILITEQKSNVKKNNRSFPNTGPESKNSSLKQQCSLGLLDYSAKITSLNIVPIYPVAC